MLFLFLGLYSKSPLSSSMGANQKPAKIPQNEEVDRIELRKNDESARINLEKAKSKYSDKMKTLKTKMKKVKEEQKDLETNLIKFNAFVKEKQLKVNLLYKYLAQDPTTNSETMNSEFLRTFVSTYIITRLVKLVLAAQNQGRTKWRNPRLALYDMYS